MSCWLFVDLVVLAVTFICLLLCFACKLFGVGKDVVPSSLAALRLVFWCLGLVALVVCLFTVCFA